LILLVNDKVRSFVSIYDSGNSMISVGTSKHINHSKLPFQASKHHPPCTLDSAFAHIACVYKFHLLSCLQWCMQDFIMEGFIKTRGAWQWGPKMRKWRWSF